MKKLLDSKFLFILALSVVVLIVLGVGAFYLFDDSDAVFVKDGYILNPLSAKNEKYVFDKDTTYKENLSSMVVFNDTDNKEVSVFKDSFLHYMDSSMSFLKNGAILDLGSISGDNAVKFYNITNKSIISKRGDSYVIETNGDDINLKNFMGRISDAKYIVAGNLRAKIPGNEKDITGNYFEVVYNEEGVVTIENSEVKYQVAADGTYIYAGDVTIDFGNKKITKGNEDVMSITAITINGNENIEIIPKAEEPSEDDGNGGADGSGQGDGQGEGQGGAGTGDNDAREDIKYEDLTISLEETEVHSTSITLVTKVINKREDDSLILRVTDLDSGKAVEKTYNVDDDQEIRVKDLAADTKYLFTVVNERDGSKYAQKMLKTNKFGVKLEQTYVMANEIGYKVTIDNDSEIEDVDVTLLRYNESTKKYDDPVETFRLSELTNNVKGEHILPAFTGLDSNTIYTVALDGFVIDSIDRKKTYNITNTALTLKETPTVSVGREIEDDYFKLFVENVHDKDGAIISYTYYVFDNAEGIDTNEFVFDAKKAVYKKEKNNAEPEELHLGQNGIVANHDYIYMVSIMYYDNEKYVEKVSSGRIDYRLTNEPFVTIQEDPDNISYDTIGATITITDNSCLLAMKGRDCFNDYENYPIVIDVRETDGYGSLVKVEGYPMTIDDFTVTGNTLRKNLVVTGLKKGTQYIITVSARKKDEADIKELKHGSVYKNDITTLWLPTFDAIWTDGESNNDDPINGTFKLKAKATELTVSEEKAISLIDKVVFRLYDGPYSKIVQQILLANSDEYMASDEFSIGDSFFNSEFSITEELFGVSGADGLRELTKEKLEQEENVLSSYYTVEAEVYYKNGERATVNSPHQFKMAAYLTSDIEAPVISLEKIYKMQGDNFNSLLTGGENGTVVGYIVNVTVDKSKYIDAGMTITGAQVKVASDSNPNVTFYTNDHGSTSNVINIPAADLGNSEKSPRIYMGDGIANGTNSIYMTRGKRYYVTVEINYDTPDGEHEKQTSERETVIDKKETPKVKKLYVAETSKTGDVTYKYIIEDVDNAWHSENNEYIMHYQVADNPLNGVAIVKNESELNTLVLTGLTKGDGYTLSYYRDNYDTGNEEFDVEKVTVGAKDRLYEGYYDASDGTYNFKYRVISDPLHDNKVVVEILANDDILDKILIYDVQFTDQKGNTYKVPNAVWNLSKCEWAGENDKNRCFEVPYTSLTKINPSKGMYSSMKSEGNEKNNITVQIEAIYDNGLMGYDYSDRVGEDKEFPYMIMQNDSTLDKVGNYVVVNNGTLQSVNPIGNRDFPLAYHYFIPRTTKIEYISRYNVGDKAVIADFDIDSRGYFLQGYGTLNPKMVSLDEMNGIDNVFYFSSITPMINIDKKISLINGARVMMTLEGADEADFCADGAGDTCNVSGTKYLYIQVLDDSTIDTLNVNNTISEPLIPTIKVPLRSGDNINGQYTQDIVNLLHNSGYAFKVYAYLNDGGIKKLTQIFDKTLKNQPDTYRFNSKKLYDSTDIQNSLLASTSVVYQPISDSADYNAKELFTTINLNSYDADVNIPYQFNVSYEFCKTANCDDTDSRVFSKDIDTTTKVMTSRQDITSDDLEYNKPYYMYLYMTYNYYDKNSGTVISKTVPVYENETDAIVNTISALAKPTFTIVRSADYIPDEGGFVIDITIGINDRDHVLTDGNYYVKLLDGSSQDGTIVGNLMLKGNDGIFRQVGETGAYDNIAFDATESGTQVRIGGLEANKSYTVVIFGDVHMKNNGYEEYDFVVSSGKEGKGDIVWTTNDYGIAFGAVSYRATQKGFIVSYGAGSNVDELHIQAIEIDIKENGREFDNKVINLGSGNKYLEVDRETGKYRFVYEYDDDKQNAEFPTYYTVATRYKVINPTTHTEEWIGKTWGEYYKALEQNVTYDPNEIIEED